MSELKEICHPVRRNGRIFVCRYTPGFYYHCILLIDAWGCIDGTTRMYSGYAEVLLPKEKK